MRISTTVDEELNNWLLEQCGGKKRGRAGFIRSVLYMVKNGIILSGDAMYVPQNTQVDNWKSIEELRRKKKVSSAIAIYPAEVMGDMMAELKERLKGKRFEETKDTIMDMREEQKKIAESLQMYPPPVVPKEE